MICATGRSGSTTLQRLINTIPNSNICGENDDTTNALLETYVHLKQLNQRMKDANQCTADGKFMTSEDYERLDLKPSLYNVFDFDDMKSRIQSALIAMMDDRQPQPRRVLGCKNIRYFGKLHLMDAFLELFPNTKIICHLREDLVAQSHSDWMKENPDAAFDYLTNYNKLIRDYVASHSADAEPKHILTTFDDLFRVDKMRNLFRFLDEPFDKTQWQQIMANNRH